MSLRGSHSGVLGASGGRQILEKKRSPVYRGLYLGWLGKYNEGDEAMYHVASELFSTIGINMGISVTLPIQAPTILQLRAFH